MLGCAPAAADLYRWVDAKGVVNYSNIPPHGVKATQIAEAEPTVSVIPPPEQRPELRQAAREAELLRRVEQLEDELAALRSASPAAIVYSYPSVLPGATYSPPVVYAYPIHARPLFKHRGGHRFKWRHPGWGSPGFLPGRPAMTTPHGGRGSGLTVRARF